MKGGNLVTLWQKRAVSDLLGSQNMRQNSHRKQLIFPHYHRLRLISLREAGRGGERTVTPSKMSSWAVVVTAQKEGRRFIHAFLVAFYGHAR